MIMMNKKIKKCVNHQKNKTFKNINKKIKLNKTLKIDFYKYKNRKIQISKQFK